MSSKFILIIVAMSTTGILLGYSGMSLAKQLKTSNASREIASAPILKMGADQISRDYFDIKIVHEKISLKNNEVSEIKAIVTALKDLPDGFRFQWLLHSDMTSTDELTGFLGALTKNESKEFYLKVFGFSKESNSHLNFLVSGNIQNHDLKRTLISSSRPEDSFQYVVEQAEKGHVNNKSAETNEKIFKKSSSRKKFDPKKIVH